MEVGAESEIGKRKSLNEDSYGVWYSHLEDSERGVFIVADGVGGEEKGEVASRKAVSVVLQEMVPLLSDGEKPEEEVINERLEEAIQLANEDIISLSADSELGKMATTATIAVLIDNYLAVGNVGDSRTYLYQKEQEGDEGFLTRITKDHSLLTNLVEKGKLSAEEIETPRSQKAKRQENVVTKVLGNKERLEPDIYWQYIYDGSQIFLCCDGVTDLIPDEKIQEVMDSTESTQSSCSNLVKMANDEGGKDNITAVMVKPTNLTSEEKIMGRDTVIKETKNNNEED